MKANWKWLQLFADGGDGVAAGDGGASTTGEASADAGHKRLLELGVPADKLKKRAKRASAEMPAGAVTTELTRQTERPEQVAAADESTEEKKESGRMTWEQIKADPEYNREMQNMIQARLKNAKQAQETLGMLTPALEKLAHGYGMDIGEKLDFGELAKKIQEDSSRTKERALELGTSEEIAAKLDQFDLEQARKRRSQREIDEDQKMQQHYQFLQRQAEEMKKLFPDFDLDTELKNPSFLRMTAPGMPISMEDAYFAVHRKELQGRAMQVAAQTAAQQISNAIQAGARPQENGTSAAAPSVTSFDYKHASKEQREALKQRIRMASARGEKIYPGTFRR